MPWRLQPAYEIGAGRTRGRLLVAAAFVFVLRRADWLADRSQRETVIIIALAADGACLAAVSIRRTVDPHLRTPILAWIVLGAFYLAGIVGAFMGSREPGDYADRHRDDVFTKSDRSTSSKDPTRPGMGEAGRSSRRCSRSSWSRWSSR